MKLSSVPGQGLYRMAEMFQPSVKLQGAKKSMTTSTLPSQTTSRITRWIHFGVGAIIALLLFLAGMQYDSPTQPKIISTTIVDMPAIVYQANVAHFQAGIEIIQTADGQMSVGMRKIDAGRPRSYYSSTTSLFGEDGQYKVAQLLLSEHYGRIYMADISVAPNGMIASVDIWVAGNMQPYLRFDSKGWTYNNPADAPH